METLTSGGLLMHSTLMKQSRKGSMKLFVPLLMTFIDLMTDVLISLCSSAIHYMPYYVFPNIPFFDVHVEIYILYSSDGSTDIEIVFLLDVDGDILLRGSYRYLINDCSAYIQPVVFGYCQRDSVISSYRENDIDIQWLCNNQPMTLFGV
jgi:hypothetical protein